MLGIVSKIDPTVILRGHFRTFGDAERHGRWKDVLLFYLLPMCIGLLTWNSKASFDLDRCTTTSINVLAIFVPLAFSVLAELFAMIDRQTMQKNHSLKRLATDLYWNVSYGVFASIIALCCLVLIEFLQIEKGKWFAGIFVAVSLHFLFTALMVIKRFAKLMDPTRR